MAEPEAELLNQITWRIPNALTLIGSRHEGRRNAMTASWVTQLAQEPVLIGVSIDVEALTHELVDAAGRFTVNLWDADDARTFVKFSKPARDGGDTLNDRPVHDAPSGLPVFDEAVAWMDCSVVHRLPLGSHTLFVGTIEALALRDPEVRVASMADTRMKYGGVRRG